MVVDRPASPGSPLLFDIHSDIPDPAERGDGDRLILDGTDTDLPLLEAGGIGALVIAGAVIRGPRSAEGVARDRAVVEAKYAAVREMIRRRPDRFELALCADDVERIAAGGRTAILLSLLGSHCLGDDLDGVRWLHGAGVRVFGMVHMGNTAFADSSRPFDDEPAGEHGGLSALGRRAVAEANRLGLMLDVSQLSPDALRQTVTLSRAPVLASHSAVRAIVDVPRNLSDEELDTVASTGGVAGIVAFSGWLRGLTTEEITARAEVAQRFGGMANGYLGSDPAERIAYYAAMRTVTTRATLDDYMNAVDYVVKRIGIDHVALSSDFNQGGGITGWSHAGEAGAVTAALEARGYGAEDIAKIWGGNMLRVMRTVERTAIALQASEEGSQA